MHIVWTWTYTQSQDTSITTASTVTKHIYCQQFVTFSRMQGASVSTVTVPRNPKTAHEYIKQHSSRLHACLHRDSDRIRWRVTCQQIPCDYVACVQSKERYISFLNDHTALKCVSRREAAFRIQSLCLQLCHSFTTKQLACLVRRPIS